jgi:hypothetical protein
MRPFAADDDPANSDEPIMYYSKKKLDMFRNYKHTQST